MVCTTHSPHSQSLSLLSSLSHTHQKKETRDKLDIFFHGMYRHKTTTQRPMTRFTYRAPALPAPTALCAHRTETHSHDSRTS